MLLGHENSLLGVHWHVFAGQYVWDRQLDVVHVVAALHQLIETLVECDGLAVQEILEEALETGVYLLFDDCLPSC